MKVAKSLADCWLEHVNHPSLSGPVSCTPEQFRERLEELMEAIAKTVAADGARHDLLGKTQSEILKIMRERYSGLFSHQGYVNNIEKYYDIAYKRQSELSNLRIQDDWATSWDHAKTFLFRMLTTVMIAAVILATGFFAQHWGIPLPMLRGL